MKIIKIKTNKNTSGLELIRVAEDRAQYYSEIHNYDMGSIEWDETVREVMDDDYLGIEWLIDNTDLEDWEPLLKKLNDDILTNDEHFWFDSDNFKIVDYEW